MANLILTLTTSGGGLATATTDTSATIAGTSLTFSAEVDHGTYEEMPETNVIWIKPSGGASTVTVNSYTPGWGAMADGRNGNGAMLNVAAINTDAGGTVGFDETPTYYDNTVRAAVPITMTPGDCLIIAQSLDNANGSACINRYVYVHCVDTIPYADEFAPPYAWPSSAGAKPRYRWSDVDENKMLGLSTSGFSNARPSLATVLPDHLKNRCLDHVMIWRRGEMEQYVDGNPVKLYGRNLQDQIDPWYAFINSDAPISEKREVAKALIQRGIDTYGVMRSAVDQGLPYLASDGGHQRGRLIQPVVAGHLLGDTTMRDYVRTTWTVNDTAATSPAEYANAIYLTPAVVDETQTVGWDGSGNGTSYPYEDAHATSPATPEWQASIDGVANGLNNVWRDEYPDLTSYYRIVGNQEVASGQTAALLVMGLRAIFDHEAFFDYAARHHALQHYGNDPWRYVNGNGAARYALMTRAPGVTAVNDFRREFYDTHIFQSATYYEFPAGVNDFSGVT